MSRKVKTGWPNDLWILEYIDKLNPSESFASEAMPRAEAEEEYARHTEQGTRNTEQDKKALGYYRLRQKA